MGQDATYTALGPSSLVTVNPYRSTPIDADALVHEYVAESWAVDGRTERLPPHIWQLACRAYFYMRRTGQDQAIVFRCVSSEAGTALRGLDTVLPRLVEEARRS